VRDEFGVNHASVLCSSDRALKSVKTEQPFVVAMCDFFEYIDASATYDAAQPEYPQRRWSIDQEAPGVITCLVCLGS
jgi:hypothetical protein